MSIKLGCRFLSSTRAAMAGTRLVGKVAIVTGGSSGYGAGITSRFASEGAKVLIADLNPPPGHLLSDSVSFQKANITKEADWHSLLSIAKSLYGAVPNVLVNNAGTTYPNKSTTEVTESEFDKCFAVNVKGVYFGCDAFIKTLLREMVKGKEDGNKGSIINIASVGAMRPRPGLVWYNASKAAICNATLGLAAEYGPSGVRVNSVCPLLGGTGLFQAFSGVPDTPENRTKFIDNVPLRRLCEPSDIANACLYLASDESSFVTGINLTVDGGRAV